MANGLKEGTQVEHVTEKKTDRFLTVPNLLTVFRILLIPAFVLVFLQRRTMIALGIFLLASFTDFLDGLIARRTGQISRVGTVLDPLADKLMLIAALACLSYFAWIPLWVLIVVMAKELIMILGGIIEWRKQRLAIPANMLGKVATVLFMLAVIMAFFHDVLDPWHLVVLYLALAVSIAAIANYARLFVLRRRG